MHTTPKQITVIKPFKWRLTKKIKEMTSKEKITEIDNILASFEDWMHGIDGDNCTKARKLLSEIEVNNDEDFSNDLDRILNEALNEAMCIENKRIKYPNSNKIAQFVIDFMKRKKLKK